MDKKIRAVARTMSVLMGVSLSLCLSLVGNALSGRFTARGFLLSFAVSTAVSLAIGFVVPMKPLCDAVCGRLKLRPRTAGWRLAEAVVSDLVYTPLITFIMVFMAWRMAVSHGAQVPFAPMFLHSLAVSLAVGYVLILVLTPIFMRVSFAVNGVDPRNPPPRREEEPAR